MRAAERYWKGKKPDGVWFDAHAADKACAFVERFCVQSQGEWAGQPIALAPWQRNAMRTVFGWKRADGTRQFRTMYVEIPRKNGKSTWASAMALLLLLADGEPGAKVFAAASDESQARIVFDEAKAMVDASPTIKRHCQVWKKSIVVPKTRSVFEVLSKIPDSKHGKNISGVVIDELHAHRSRELYDVLRTSTGSRRQPLVIVITTAGYDRTSVCWEQHLRSVTTMADPMADPTHFGLIYAAGEHDKWTSPKAWERANPNLGVTVKRSYLEELAREAELTPGLQNNFLRLHLNLWTSQETRWLDMRRWDRCKESEPVDLRGRACYAGLDLASTSDMAALALVFPPVEESEPYRVRVWYWIPGDNVEERVRKTGTPYNLWARQGLLKATPGDVIDYDAILTDVVALGREYDVMEVAFDRWGAHLLSQNLTNEGFTMVEFGQGYRSMAAPTKEFARMVARKEIAHDGNPILRWNVDNVQVSQDPAGNLKPNKATSKGKIDGLVATLMGLDRAIVNNQSPASWSGGELAVL